MSSTYLNVGSAIKSMETTHQSIVILRCKVVIVGDACVGKSALTQVFQSGGSTYPKNYLMTIGAEFSVKQVPIPETNYVVELFLYDCAGQSIFNQLDLNSKYYQDAAAILVAYSVTSKESLQSCGKWLTSVKAALNTTAANNSNNSPICLMVGCKNDLRDGTVDSRAEVGLSEGKSVANGLGVAFFETAAVNNINVEEPFRYIAEEFLKRYEESAERGV